ncbi:DUF6883 domain-containing protein [Halochromatium salexigens]|uniref:DUF6883 domain-containing protein n=1 Tax=Halochromatium salexigens TaxID=49447 RepID=A0AAJ0UIE7_HALSE|nr:hypothetical protein [Halochromatium salexigens]
MRLPNANRAAIRPEKITHYLLSDDHPAGRHKARFFRACGFSKAAWKQLEAALLQHAVEHPVYEEQSTPFGVSYAIDGPLPSPDGRAPSIRAIWFLESGQNAPQFVTAYPLKARRN